MTPALFDRFRARIETLKDEPGTFWTDQFHNADALNGYREIGVELLEQVGRIDAFCGATGTADTGLKYLAGDLFAKKRA